MVTLACAFAIPSSVSRLFLVKDWTKCRKIAVFTFSGVNWVIIIFSVKGVIELFFFSVANDRTKFFLRSVILDSSDMQWPKSIYNLFVVLMLLSFWFPCGGANYATCLPIYSYSFTRSSWDTIRSNRHFQGMGRSWHMFRKTMHGNIFAQFRHHEEYTWHSTGFPRCLHSISILTWGTLFFKLLNSI